MKCNDDTFRFYSEITNDYSTRIIVDDKGNGVLINRRWVVNINRSALDTIHNAFQLDWLPINTTKNHTNRILKNYKSHTYV